eukprot:249000_1
MSTPFTKAVTKSSKLSFCVGRWMPKPLPHPTNSECIIVSTHYGETETTPAIYTYNPQTNESQIIYKYDGTFKPSSHDQFIDTSNNTLILYGGLWNTFKVFDLNTNQIKQIN